MIVQVYCRTHKTLVRPASNDWSFCVNALATDHSEEWKLDLHDVWCPTETKSGKPEHEFEIRIKGNFQKRTGTDYLVEVDESA